MSDTGKARFVRLRSTEPRQMTSEEFVWFGSVCINDFVAWSR